ncbi:MAG: glucans biosynthesis glucosyltransferase MdoH [Pseudomonadota bacterium]
MALPLDRLTPPLSPLAMPAQDLFGPHRPLLQKRAVCARVLGARVVLTAITIAATVYACREMHGAASPGDVAPLEWLLIAVFAIAFAWIAFSAANALTGLLLPHRPRPTVEGSAAGKTALVMPVYNEDPRTTFSALAAIVRDLPPSARGDFEVFILSDTTDPETWVAEEDGLAVLRRLAGDTPVWYRRRPSNIHRKAGNVADFVRRWGGRYDHMIVLDADSLMTGDCLLALRTAMAEDPQAGIIQTAPLLIGAATPFARAQEFANTIAGPTVARGVAAWQGEDGNYWGHNAIIRMEAFAAAAGLPQLSGSPPFGGTILSHDFVEAALIRRAGYTVTLRTDIEGSYEGAPSDLFGVIKRDRRWAQGNLQHARIFGASGLAGASRLHFAIGILAYVMSPVWLLLILIGVALSIQATLVRPAYFPDTFALFPNWPVFDVARMVALLGFAAFVLLLPKMIAVADALSSPRVRAAAGGRRRILVGALTELLISTLVAPIMMMAQSGIVLSILSGRAVGWTPQMRECGSIPLPTALRFHAVATGAGLGLALIALLHSPTLAAWMSPTLVALILAAPISKAAGSARLGSFLKARRLLATPQENCPPSVAREAERFTEKFRDRPRNAIVALLAMPTLYAAHRNALDTPCRRRGAVDAATATATVKLAEAQSLEEYADWLAPAERLRVLSEPHLLDGLTVFQNSHSQNPLPLAGSHARSA